MGDDPRAYTPETPGRRLTTVLVGAAVAVAVAAAAVVVVHDVRLRREAAARERDAKKGRQVTIGRIDRRPARVTVRLPGDIHGFTETPVYAKVAGYLKRIEVDKGDRVKAGQELALLESPELDQEVRNAHANFDLRRATDQRFETLRRSGVASQQDADQAHADFLQAVATLKQVEALQEYLRITADFDGAVTARYADPGTLIPQSTSGGVAASTPVLAMATLSPLRVYVDLPQANAPYVRDGDPAVVTVTEYAGREFPGAVTRHPQALASATRTMLVEVDLPNDDGALLPGMYAQVSIELAGRETTMRVPDDVLIFRDGKTFVPVVDGNALRVVPVTLGYDDGRLSEVVAGLAGDEVLAMNVGQTARDGEVVQVRDPQAAAGTAQAQPSADHR
jgi:RND family efflux transporter MFP subunit